MELEIEVDIAAGIIAHLWKLPLQSYAYWGKRRKEEIE